MKRLLIAATAMLMFFSVLLLWRGSSDGMYTWVVFMENLISAYEETGETAVPAETGCLPDAVTAGVSDTVTTGADETVCMSDAVTAGADETVSSASRQVALTFDDGPHAIYTPILLDGLKERGVKATFFLMGQNIEGNEEIVKRISDEGHLIGNHTYSHVQLTAISETEALSEVEKDTRLIESITGVEVAYIRPPYGSVTQSLAEGMNLRIVLWDIDPRDWESQNASLVAKHILNHIGDGEIILLHDIFRSSVEAALMVIDELTAQGYEFVRVDELGMYE